MSQLVDGPRKSFKSATDLSSSLYYIVKLSAAETVALATAGTDAIVGTIEEVFAANDTVSVRLRNASGTGKVIASGIIAAGAKITANNAGKAVTTTSNHDQILGMAIEAAGADGDIIEYMPMTGMVSS